MLGLPQWISPDGRMVLLGDSAHAMLPDAAQGFSTTAESVGVLFHLLSLYHSRGVPALTKIWQEARLPRVNRIKAWARLNHALFTQGTSLSSEATEGKATMQDDIPLDQVEMDLDAEFLAPAFLKWAFWFDPVADVEGHIARMDKASL